MDIILWRHAQAEEGSDDLARRLTEKGHRQAQLMAAQLSAKLPEQYQLWASEAARSRQTAAYLQYPMQVRPQINPDARAQDVAALLAEVDECDTVVLVGHQPWLGAVCAFLLNRDWHVADWSVKKGAVWWFRCRRNGDVYAAKLHGMYRP